MLQSDLDLPLVRRGKVRDVYEAGRSTADRRHRSHLGVRLRARVGHPRQGAHPDADLGLLVRAARATSCRITCCRRSPPTSPPRSRAHADALRGRSMLVRRTEPLPIECVARGYLSGSGWKDYQRSGAVCGIALPAGLRESSRLPEPIFTPATKADTRPRREHHRGGGRVAHRRRARRTPAASSRSSSTRAAPRHAEAGGHHRRRHEVRVRPLVRRRWVDRPGPRRDHPHRRGAHARLARGSGRRTSTRRADRSPASTSSSCATTSSRSAGTSSRPCPSLPDDVVERTREQVPRGVPPRSPGATLQ